MFEPESSAYPHKYVPLVRSKNWKTVNLTNINGGMFYTVRFLKVNVKMIMSI